MFEVTGYDYPNVFVRCRRTAETYLFQIGNDGALTQGMFTPGMFTPGESRCDQDAARRAAMAYLDRLKTMQPV
jgi:hypothetical protein